MLTVLALTTEEAVINCSGESVPVPSWGAAKEPAACGKACWPPHPPSLLHRTPQHGHAHPRAPDPWPDVSSEAKAAANGSWLGCSAGTEKKQTRSRGAESRRGCAAGQGMLRFGSIIDLLGLPRLFTVKMFRPVITLASLKYPSLI